MEEYMYVDNTSIHLDLTQSENIANITGPHDENYPWNYTYIGICVPVITFCILSVGVNLFILSSYFWIRKPISHTIHISLSLALSDLCTFVLDILNITFNSLLPVGFGVRTSLSLCSLLLLEAFRLGVKLTTLLHLLTLTLHHYLGIRKPLQYKTCMTRKITCCVTMFLWIAPPAALISYLHSLEDDGFSVRGCDAKFIRTWKFRTAFSLIFFISIIIMGVLYCDIYTIVREHQATRNRYKRTGSMYKGTHQDNNINKPDSKEIRNERKAFYTTLVIVGSTVIGWMPASLSFWLVCKDCYFEKYSSEFWMIFINALSNILLILKTALNSYIYIARMQEIRRAIGEMCRRLRRIGGVARANDTNRLSESRQMYSRNSSRRSQRTVHCRIQSLQRHNPTNTSEL